MDFVVFVVEGRRKKNIPERKNTKNKSPMRENKVGTFTKQIMGLSTMPGPSRKGVSLTGQFLP